MSRPASAMPRVLKLSTAIPVNRHDPSSSGPYYTHEVVWTVDGKRHRKRFRTKMEAEMEANALRNRLVAAGGSATELRPGDAEALAEARALLDPHGVSILDAARCWLEQHRRQTASIPLPEAVGLFLEAKARAGMRPRALESLRNDLRRFATAHSDALAASISSAILSRWLDSLHVAPLTKLSTLRRVGSFLNWCAKKGFCEKGIVADVERPRVRAGETELFSVDEARALLETASSVAPAMVPYLALGLFCGLRTAELDRLQWNHVNEKEVRIEADVAKTASRRVVPLPGNASAWLAPHRRKTGPVRPVNARRLLDRVCKAAGVEWKTNAMRHSFASYRLAACNDAPRVSLELGHTSPTLVFRHYRTLVSEEEAGRYFSLAPQEACADAQAIRARHVKVSS